MMFYSITSPSLLKARLCIIYKQASVLCTTNNIELIKAYSSTKHPSGGTKLLESDIFRCTSSVQKNVKYILKDTSKL